MARPRKEIDKTQFEKLCSYLCTEEEIASFFDCSIDTIQRWCKREYKASFADIYKKHSAVGRISLRRYQFRLAEHNASMAIWLGKQYLNQHDEADDYREAKINLAKAQTEKIMQSDIDIEDLSDIESRIYDE